jgi:hypothetical protein
VADSTWLTLREQGAIVEEADDDGDEGDLGTEDKLDEKDILAEKVGLHLQDIDIGARVDITNVEGQDDGTRKEIRLEESETNPPVLK